MIPQQTSITADTHAMDFDDLCAIIRRLDRPTVKIIRNYLSQLYPTLVQGFPTRVVLPEPIEVNPLKNAIQGLVKTSYGYGVHNTAIQEISQFIERKPEVFLSLINDVFKCCCYDQAQFE